MERLIISTGLERFVLPDRITHVTDHEISLVKHIEQKETPLFIGIETLAQAGAFHVRHLNNFKRHAFLLGIRNLISKRESIEQGILTVTGILKSRSKDAFSYELKGDMEGHTILSGIYLFSVIEYNSEYSEKQLENHYKKAFSCLINDTGTS